MVLCCSAAPQEGCWFDAVQLLHRGLLVFCYSGVPREGSWWCAFQLLRESEANVMMFDSSKGGQLVLCWLAASG
jgi:hypothetical protein